ncbi:methyltransferase domain-containing protein [Aquincola sp. MAHUQ-54]|uniref:Methyltransferase domain-containing protein n=1 Tax=Aquincola agrisoli TaxID=3119538 RepID=A0AAW9QA83_9BURK
MPDHDDLVAWLATPPGRYLLAWEQDRLDRAVVDLFGFHALQLGLPQLDALRANRMPHRWLATDAPQGIAMPPRAVSLHCDFDALPFPSQSLDLVVLPHTLEWARDPHLTLAEVERVLMPEGRVAILGFNPAGLWGLRQRLGRLRRGLGGTAPLYLPRASDLIHYRRLRDWLRLLSFEVEGGRFGCYRPALRSERWLDRFGWMDDVGDRWWPVLGSVYFLLAVKRVRGMRLVGLARRQRSAPHAAPAVVAQRRPSMNLDNDNSRTP